MNDHTGAHRDPEARLVGRFYVEDPEAALRAMKLGTPTGDWYPFTHDCHGAADDVVEAGGLPGPPPYNGTGVDNDGLSNGTF